MVEERVAGGAVSRLIIRQVKMNDSAEFCCLAGNSYGRANTSIVLIVEVRTLESQSPVSSLIIKQLQ